MMAERIVKILIVDDEEPIGQVLKAGLEMNGFAVRYEARSTHVIKACLEFHPDLVLLDITMPEKSGVRFYRDLKEDPQLRSTPVIVVTAVTGYGADPAPFRNFLGTRSQVPPPEGFFSKPIDRETFLAAVKGVLG